MEYLIEGNLENKIYDITYDQLKILYDDNLREAEESQRITESSYRGENYYTTDEYLSRDFEFECLLRDPKTSGMRIYYPHGVVIGQSKRRNYYRGENQVFKSSIPSLLRKLAQYDSYKERELYRMVADMRIAEFSFFLQKFQHVQNWKESDILYEPLAQHYGLETGWLDITSDFNTALFFATCYWDGKQWLPLTKDRTEIDEKHQFGMIFHMPSNRMPMRWLEALEKLKPWTDQPIEEDGNGNIIYGKLDYPIYRGDINNIIYPLGFQPFMRCHMQNGYGIYMRKAHPLQEDFEFEKLRFRHSEKLSQKVYDLMKGGELIYPHEGLREAQFVIDHIRTSTTFSEEAFQYALYRSHYFRLVDSDKVKEALHQFRIEGNNIEITNVHPWKISSGRRKRIDRTYQDFSVQERYGILILDRPEIPEPSAYFEPWMYPDQENEEGVKDFKIKDKIECGSSIAGRNMISILSMVKNARFQDF